MMKCTICQRDFPEKEISYVGGICSECWQKELEEHEGRMKEIRARTGGMLPPVKILHDGKWLSESKYLAAIGKRS